MSSTIVLDHHATAFIQSEIGSGRYGSASEVVLAGLQLLEQQRSELDALRVELAKGLASGPAKPVEIVLDRLEMKYRNAVPN